MEPSLPFIASGNRHGTPLLLIHPMGADKDFWDDCRPLWDARFFSVACDLRGAGPTPLGGALTFARHVADLEGLAASLNLQRMLVVGCAVGSMIATQYAATHPRRVAGLILSNPGIRTREAARPMLAKRAADVRAGGLAAVADAVIASTFFGQPDDAARARFAAGFRAQDAEAYARTIEAMLDADIRPALARIDCPILLVPGELDRLLPPDHAEEIRLLKPAAEVVLVRGAAHFIPCQRPMEFARLAAAFADRHRSGAT